LFWVVVVVTIGSRTIDGAIVAGLVLVLLPELLENLGAATGFEFVLFGFGAVVYARHPDGVLTALERAALRFGSRLRTELLGWGSASLPVPTPQPEPGSVHLADVEPRVTAHTEYPSRPASLLEVEEITKRFAGITALYDVSLQVEPGEIVGLIGPNGAGKTTLFDCLTGLLRPDAGRVTFDGQLITQLRADDRARLGIARTFQRCELWPGLSVRDHLLVAEAGCRGNGGLVRDLRTRGRTSDDERDRADTMLARLGLLDDRDRSIEELSLGRARLVELARALEMEPRLLLLDEPSSGLGRAEMLEVGAVIDRVRRERDTGILLVEHDLEMVRRFTERLYVINAGQLIAAGPTHAVMADPIVRAAYLGVTDPGAEQ
jgi:branched-chain amino acid transport system ATP-binding protein